MRPIVPALSVVVDRSLSCDCQIQVVDSPLHHHSHIVSCPHEAQLINPSEQTPRTEASSKKNSRCFHSIVRFQVLIHSSFNQCRVHAVRVPDSSKLDSSGRLHVGSTSRRVVFTLLMTDPARTVRVVTQLHVRNSCVQNHQMMALGFDESSFASLQLDAP